jgi:hypothetical protein
MVVACIALAVALGGTGYAATTLPKKSVGHEQIRNGAVGNLQIRDGAITKSKLRNGSVTSSATRDGSLRVQDFAKGVLPTTVVRQVSGDQVAAGAVGAVSASCNSGERATGGGGGFAGPPTTNDKMVDSIPVGDERPVLRWRVSLFNGGTAPRTPVAYVLCEAP